jgi:hypothetical protein
LLAFVRLSGHQKMMMQKSNTKLQLSEIVIDSSKSGLYGTQSGIVQKCGEGNDVMKLKMRKKLVILIEVGLGCHGVYMVSSGLL